MTIKALFVTTVHQVCVGFYCICEEGTLEKSCVLEWSARFSRSNSLPGLHSENTRNFVLEGETFEKGIIGQQRRTEMKGESIS